MNETKTIIVKRTPIAPNINRNDYNNNNLHEYDPYILINRLTDENDGLLCLSQETETETETDTETEREERKTETEKERERDRETERQREKHVVVNDLKKSKHKEKEDRILIDKDWFDSLTPYVKLLIDQRLGSLGSLGRLGSLGSRYILGKVAVPHIVSKDNSSKMLLTVYQTFIDGFDYNVWYNPDLPDGPRGVKMFHISDEVKKCLLFDVDLDSALTEFSNDIQNFIESSVKSVEYKSSDNSSSNSFFVRLSSTSGKNERAVSPLKSAKDIIKHMKGNSLFVNQEYNRQKPSYLILIPWNEKIDPRYEFRIFVVNNRLTAASPQKWWELIQHTGEELELFEEAFANIKFINHIHNPYHTFIADVYVDVQTRSVKLIEFNPFGAHCGAGSSLFNWITDYDLLHGHLPPSKKSHEKSKEGQDGTEDPKSLEGSKSSEVAEIAVLRYLSAINY